MEDSGLEKSLICKICGLKSLFFSLVIQAGSWQKEPTQGQAEKSEEIIGEDLQAQPCEATAFN